MTSQWGFAMRQATWWWDANGTWTPFADKPNKAAEEGFAAWQKDKSTTGAGLGAAAVGATTIVSGGRSYVLSYPAMTQTNTTTRGSRRIRRTMEDGDQDWACGECTYHNVGSASVCVQCGQAR